MVDAALIIAFLLSLFKLAEMALRPHQKKILLTRLEEMTLRLEYAVPHYRNWISEFTSLSQTFVIAASIALFLVGLIIVPHAPGIWPLLGWYVCIHSLGMLEASRFWRFAPEFLERYRVQSISVAGFKILMKAIFAAFLILGASGLIKTFAPLAVIFIILVVFRPRVYYYMVGFPYMVLGLAIAFATLSVAKPFLKVGLGLLWRIVEYPSGPWAAFLFLIASLLGLAKVFVG